jgi:hypothetical protein
MSFADNYLANQENAYISTAPDNHLSGAVVIPCFSEPDIKKTLYSIGECTAPEGLVEIIVVVNFPENSPEEIVAQNKETFHQLIEFSKTWEAPNRKLFPIWVGAVRKKFAGPGYARKMGMDEAIRRFNAVDNSLGFIASMDADTTVSENYLVEIERIFKKNSKVRQLVIPFQHPKGNIANEVREAITLYELYLRYYRLSMQFIGWPWAYHTVGSAFAVRASVYVEQGGMNRRNAGEDFYFLNKLFPLGGTFVPQNVMVFPAARISTRVLFGTGMAVKQITENSLSYKVYSFQSFLDLQYFTKQSDALFHASDAEVAFYVAQAPEALNIFWQETDFIGKVKECNTTCTSINSFRKRLFRNFDAFQVVKFLNFAHEKLYVKGDISTEFLAFLKTQNQMPATQTGIQSLLQIAERLENIQHRSP